MAGQHMVAWRSPKGSESFGAHQNQRPREGAFECCVGCADQTDSTDWAWGPFWPAPAT